MTGNKLFISLLCFASLFSSLAAHDPWLLKDEVISQNLENFDCHSSSIVETAPGHLCAVWKGGPGEGLSNIDLQENVGIWMSTYDEDGWSNPYELVSTPNSVCWNPVICKNLEGELLLFYRVGPNPRSVVSFLKRSYDGGITWSEEELLPAGIVGPTSNQPLFTAHGSLIAPSSVEVGEPGDSWKATACWIEISHDNGFSWEKVGPLEHPTRKFGVIEPALFWDADQNMRLLCRDRANKIGETGYLWLSVSEDEGRTWSPLKQTAIPNPDSGIDIADLGNGILFLFYNHSHLSRYPLNMAVSLDGGDSWSKPFYVNIKGEFPSAIVDSDGLIHVTYAYPCRINNGQQRMVKHAIIDPKMVIDLLK